MVVGARKGHLAQRRGDRLGVAAGIAGRCTTPTRKLRAGVVGFVGVEAPLHRATGDPERLSAYRRLDRLEVDPLGRARTDQRVDLGFDLGNEGAFEAPFLAAEGSAAWGALS
jgi:hypothetical protein